MPEPQFRPVTAPHHDPETVQQVKARARQMTQTLRAQGVTTATHTDCLHALAQTAGYRNWNEYSGTLRRDAGHPPTRTQARAHNRR